MCVVQSASLSCWVFLGVMVRIANVQTMKVRQNQVITNFFDLPGWFVPLSWPGSVTFYNSCITLCTEWTSGAGTSKHVPVNALYWLQNCNLLFLGTYVMKTLCNMNLSPREKVPESWLSNQYHSLLMSMWKSGMTNVLHADFIAFWLNQWQQCKQHTSSFGPLDI